MKYKIWIKRSYSVILSRYVISYYILNNDLDLVFYIPGNKYPKKITRKLLDDWFAMTWIEKQRVLSWDDVLYTGEFYKILAEYEV